jgi:hypothetical protein
VTVILAWLATVVWAARAVVNARGAARWARGRTADSAGFESLLVTVLLALFHSRLVLFPQALATQEGAALAMLQGLLVMSVTVAGFVTVRRWRR